MYLQLFESKKDVFQGQPDTSMPNSYSTHERGWKQFPFARISLSLAGRFLPGEHECVGVGKNLWASKICSLYFSHWVPLPIQLTKPVSPANATNFNSMPCPKSACGARFCGAACCPKLHTITLFLQSPMDFSSATVKIFLQKRMACY